MLVFALWTWLNPRTESFLLLSQLDRAAVIAAFITFLFILISVLPYYSLATWFRFLSVLTAYFFIRITCSTQAARWFFYAGTILTAVFFSIYGLFQLKGVISNSYWFTPEYLASRFVNSGHFAGWLVIPVFFLLIFISQSRRWNSRLLGGLLLLILAFVLVLTRSRTVWISLAGGLFIYFVLIVFIQKWPRYLIVAAGLFLLGIGSAALVSGLLNPVIERFAEAKALNFFSIHHRIHFWTAGAAAIAERPWGWGLGTFVHIIPQFRGHSDRFIIDYAHNELVQIGVDLGVAGCLLFLAFLGFYFKHSWHVIRDQNQSASARIETAGISCAVMVLAVASLSDFPLHIYATAVLAAAALGIQSSLSPVKASKPFAHIRKAALLMFLLALGGFLFSAAYLRAEKSLIEGRKLESDFEWDKAMAYYHQAIRFSPWAAEPYEAAGRLAEKRAALSMTSDKRKLLEEARNYYKDAVVRQPFWPASYYKAGVLSALLGDKQKALALLQKAHEREPSHPLYLFEYALYTLKIGDKPDGLRLMKKFSELGYYDPVGLTQAQILEEIYPYVTDPAVLQTLIFEGPESSYELAYFLIQHAKAGAAGPVLQKAAIELEQKYGYTYYLEHYGIRAAQAYAGKGQWDSAASIYEEALERGEQPGRFQNYLDAVRAAQRKEWV